MRATQNLKKFSGYKGNLFATFSDSKVYCNEKDLFIITKNFGREGPLGINIGPLPLSSFSNEIEITEMGIISGKIYIAFNDCDFWDQKINDKIPKELKNMESEIKSELKKRIDPMVALKIDSLLEKRDYKKLIGLGPGLTPLGDDILTGMVLVNKNLSNLDIESIFSKHLFQHAINNEVPYSIMKFLKTLNINFLKKMGSSSGLGYGLGIIKSI
jgi:hypothetical protein